MTAVVFDYTRGNRPRLLWGDYTIRFVPAPGGPDWSGQSQITLPAGRHSGAWRRLINGTALAEVTVDCCEVPEILEVCEWGHYIEIIRTGYPFPLFVGPVIGAEEAEASSEESGDLVTIRAADPSAWFWEVGLDRDYINQFVDSSTVFRYLVGVSDSKNRSGLTYLIDTTGHVMSTAFMRSDGKLVGHYLASVSRSSIDWTVYGATLIAGAFAIPSESRTILSSWWRFKPGVRRIGTDVSTFVEAFGGNNEDGGESSQVTASAGGTSAKYGRHERFVVDSEIEDALTAQRLAQSIVDHEQEPPSYVNAFAGGFGSDCELDFDDLIAGRLFLLSSDTHLEPDKVVKRLHELEVQWENGSETGVYPRFEPVGREGT